MVRTRNKEGRVKKKSNFRTRLALFTVQLLFRIIFLFSRKLAFSSLFLSLSEFWFWILNHQRRRCIITSLSQFDSRIVLYRRRRRFNSNGDGAVNVLRRRRQLSLRPNEIVSAAVAAGRGGRGDFLGPVVPAQRRRGQSDFRGIAESLHSLRLPPRRQRHQPHATLLHNSGSVQTGNVQSLSS